MADENETEVVEERFALVENGVVTNVIIGPADGYVACSEDIGIGWSHDGEEFLAPAPEPEPEPEPEPVMSPVEKLAAFLAANPDVAALIS